MVLIGAVVIAGSWALAAVTDQKDWRLVAIVGGGFILAGLTLLDDS